MTVEELRAWLESHPGQRVRDRMLHTVVLFVDDDDEEAKEEFVAFVTWLIDEEGTDVNFRDEEDGCTPFFLISSPELISLFLNRGADLRSLYRRGRTPLMTQAEMDRVACVALLLEDTVGRATVNMEVKSKRDIDCYPGYTAFHKVCCRPESEMEHTQMIELLLGAGADTTMRESRGWTAEDVWCYEHPGSIFRERLFRDSVEGEAPSVLCTGS